MEAYRVELREIAHRLEEIAHAGWCGEDASFAREYTRYYGESIRGLENTRGILPRELDGELYRRVKISRCGLRRILEEYAPFGPVYSPPLSCGVFPQIDTRK